MGASADGDVRGPKGEGFSWLSPGLEAGGGVADGAVRGPSEDAGRMPALLKESGGAGRLVVSSKAKTDLATAVRRQRACVARSKRSISNCAETPKTARRLNQSCKTSSAQAAESLRRSLVGGLGVGFGGKIGHDQAAAGRADGLAVVEAVGGGRRGRGVWSAAGGMGIPIADCRLQMRSSMFKAQCKLRGGGSDRSD